MVRYNYFSVSLINNGTLICEKKPGTFLKSGYTPVLGNIGLGRAFLDEHQRLVRRVSNHVSNRMGTHRSFFIYGQPTFLLHYRIHGFLTGGIVNLGIVSNETNENKAFRKRFQGDNSNICHTLTTSLFCKELFIG